LACNSINNSFRYSRFQLIKPATGHCQSNVAMSLTGCFLVWTGEIAFKLHPFIWMRNLISKIIGIKHMTNNLGRARRSVRAAAGKIQAFGGQRTARPVSFASLVCQRHYPTLRTIVLLKPLITRMNAD
jgi:hypothetical protein